MIGEWSTDSVSLLLFFLKSFEPYISFPFESIEFKDSLNDLGA